MQCSQSRSEPILETGIIPGPLGHDSDAQPAGAWHPSREIVLLYPIMRAFREGLYNMHLFPHYRAPKPPRFFPANRTKKKGREKHDSMCEYI